MKVLLFALGALLALSALLGATHLGAFKAPPPATTTAAPAMAQSAAPIDSSLDIYHQLTILRTNMVPALKDTESWAKGLATGSKTKLDNDIFIKLWNFRIQANVLKQRAQAEAINPDVRQAAEATWQELDELVSGLNDADVVQLTAGDFGKALGPYRDGVAVISGGITTNHT
jgi:hypothetical protein